MPVGRAEHAGGASQSHATSIDGAEHRVRLTNVMAVSVGKVRPEPCVFDVISRAARRR
jgi:hypothetical protein